MPSCLYNEPLFTIRVVGSVQILISQMSAKVPLCVQGFLRIRDFSSANINKSLLLNRQMIGICFQMHLRHSLQRKIKSGPGPHLILGTLQWQGYSYSATAFLCNLILVYECLHLRKRVQTEHEFWWPNHGISIWRTQSHVNTFTLSVDSYTHLTRPALHICGTL